MSATVQDAKSDCVSFLEREMSGSGILPETWKALGVYLESNPRNIAKGINCPLSVAEKFGPCIIFPRYDVQNSIAGVFQIKPQNPRKKEDGKPIKYETPWKTEAKPSFYGSFDDAPFIAITEGAKKAVAGMQDGVCTIALSGIWNWTRSGQKDANGRKILCDELRKLDWTGKQVFIVFDTDTRINPNVNQAACELAEALEQQGAKVSILRFPVEYDTERQAFQKYGIDDWIVAKGAGSFRNFIDQSTRSLVVNSIEQHRDEMRQQREAVRSMPGIFLDRSGTGSGKSFADIIELLFYKRSLTIVPRHEIGWEVLEKYRAAGINAAIYPELSNCEKVCKGAKCWRFKYGSDACVKGCCENYDEVAFALKMGFSASETVCLNCRSKDDCVYRKRIAAVDRAKHIIATNNRFSLSFGSIAEPADFVTIHESILETLRPTTEIGGKANTIAALAATRDAAGKIPGLSFFDDMDKHLFAWRLRNVTESFLEVFRTDPKEVQGGRLDTGPTDASVVRGLNYDLFKLLRDSDIPKESGNVLKLCVYAATGALADCVVKVSETKTKDGPKRFVSIVGTAGVSLPENAVVILNDASANIDTLRDATGLNIADITPATPVENIGRIVQCPVDITQRTNRDKVLGLLRSLMLQYSSKEKIGVITHRAHLEHIKTHLTESEKARIVKADYFRGLASRGSNDWMQCDLLLVIGTPRVPPEVVETALIRSGHPEAIPRVIELGKPNWGPDYWLGRREDGKAVIVRNLSYYDHHWQQAHRSIVAEELRQCVGRARAVCADGVPDTVVISTENMGLPLFEESPQIFAEGFLRGAASVLSLFFQAQTVVAHRKKGGNYAQDLLNNIIIGQVKNI